MRPLHFFGLQAPKAYGGAELDSISYAITIEEISRVSAAVGLCLTVHNSVGIYPIERFGTEEQKRRFLPAMTSGERIGAFCLTEANAGSDAGGVETIAVRDGKDYVINGTKIFVTNGGVCGTAAHLCDHRSRRTPSGAPGSSSWNGTPPALPSGRSRTSAGCGQTPFPPSSWRSAASRRRTCSAVPATGSRSAW